MGQRHPNLLPTATRTRSPPSRSPSSLLPGRGSGDASLEEQELPWFQASLLSPPAPAAGPLTDSASESDTCVMEKRDVEAGDTVKREKGAGVGAAGAGAAGSRAMAKAALACISGKSSSHANPSPATQVTMSLALTAWDPGPPRSHSHGPGPASHDVTGPGPTSHAARTRPRLQ